MSCNMEGLFRDTQATVKSPINSVGILQMKHESFTNVRITRQEYLKLLDVTAFFIGLEL